MSTSKSQSRIGSTISIKALGIIAVLAIVHQIYISEIMEDTDELEFAETTYGLSALVAGIVAIVIAKRYRGSDVFGKTYTALGIGLLLLFVGDATYIYYENTGQDPYPSIADVFFLASYPFLAFHLVGNIRYFKKDLKWGPKVGVPVLTLIIVLGFAYFSSDLIEEEPFDFYFGLSFVLASAGIFSLAILGASVFRNSVLGTAWLLLAAGIFIFTVADVWYYYLELVEEYTSVHVTNTLWVLSNMIIVYALYKHKKTI